MLSQHKDLVGRKYVKTYRYLYCICFFIGAIWTKELVWKFVDDRLTLLPGRLNSTNVWRFAVVVVVQAVTLNPFVDPNLNR